MRKRLLCAALLTAALLFCACARQEEISSGHGAGASAPGSSSVSTFEAQTSSPGSTQSSGTAGQPGQNLRTLSAEEMDALWAKLAGKWILSDSEKWEAYDGFAYPVYAFQPSRTEEGYYALMEYSACGSGGVEWDFDSAAEKDGVYTLTAVREAGEMSVCECRPGSGTQFTLRLDGEQLSAAWTRPTCIWQQQEPEAEPPVRYTVRLAEPEEELLLTRDASGEGRVMLEDGTLLIAGFQQEENPFRKVTDRALEELVYGPRPESRTLSEEEMEALWMRLDGIWVLEEPAMALPAWNAAHPLQSLVAFVRGENGQYALKTGLPGTEWESAHIGTVAEQSGVYTFAADEKWGMMLCNEYEPGVSDTFTLTLEESGTITLSVSAPAKYGQSVTVLTDEGDEMSGCRWRLATPEEERQEADHGTNGVLTLENGDQIAASFSCGAIRYRRETPEEAARRTGA